MSGNFADDDLRRQKQDIRRTMETRRAEAQAQNPEAKFQLRDQFLKSITLPPHSLISFYAARGSEIDPAPLAEALHGQGHTLCLPAVTGKGVALIFRAYTPGDALTPGMLAIPEPAATAPAVEPDIILVPLLAFDRHMHRIGYGAGYYDRTLTSLRQKRPVTAIGLGFACQEVPEIPAHSGDAKLDKIVTEIHTI